MKALFAIIAVSLALQNSPNVESTAHQHHHACDHSHGVVVEMVDSRMARATRYRAVCSRGDLNSSFSSRSSAVRAARSHQRATGHSTSVRKQ